MPSIHFVERDSRESHALALSVHARLAHQTDRLIVDLGGGDVDSLVLHMLVVADRALAARGGRMVVVCAQGPARTALRASGLDIHLQVVGDLSQAADLLDPLRVSSIGEADTPERGA